jgi:tripartite ATP-independent transporter DctM subunit
MIVEVSSETVVLVMSLALLLTLVSGYPLGFGLGGLAVIFGLLFWGPQVFEMFYSRMYGLLSSYSYLAIPMFVFMGVMVERSGVAERLFEVMHMWMGGLGGGLAMATVMIGAMLAACVGVIAASITMLGMIAFPSMLKKGYNKELACGAVCAGGSLGILIPPSVMLVVYGPMAELSVGKLLMAAFVPGFMLAGLYVVYIGVRCLINPSLAPVMPAEERKMPLGRKLWLLITSMVPLMALILAVLGSIFFGIAAPTEAAAVGALASIALAAGYRSLNRSVMKEAMLGTLKMMAMLLPMAVGASMFTGIFLGMGGGDVVAEAILAAPGGRWGSFTVIMLIMVLLGMFMGWLPILMIMIPLVTPIGYQLGFDPIWFALMICINLQIGFISPPFAVSIFYLRGMAQPEWGINMAIIIRGVLPYIGLIAIGIALCVAFPQIVLWLPGAMIR